MNPIRLVILGSTGSVGRQALDVVASNPDLVQVVALAAGRHGYALGEQAAAFGVKRLAVATTDAADEALDMVPGATVGAGAAAVEELAALPEADVVLNALVGSVGLRATIRALESGKRLALANKESLVAGGELVTRLVDGPDRLVPVDSEHSAIFQCMVGERADEVERIWLTASGGPFRGMSRTELDEVEVSQALRHPRWNMGPKITIDSATLMNKGLEAIEVHHLFGLPYDAIRTVVHPQSCVHSMVEFRDGSVKAHLGATDMRIPIQYALSYPERWGAPTPPVDFAEIGRLDFEEPNLKVFRCLAIAIEAGRAGGTMPAAMNAANEVAVAAYLEHRCRLTDIDRVVDSVLSQHTAEPLSSVEQVEAVDAWARAVAERLLAD